MMLQIEIERVKSVGKDLVLYLFYLGGVRAAKALVKVWKPITLSGPQMGGMAIVRPPTFEDFDVFGLVG